MSLLRHGGLQSLSPVSPPHLLTSWTSCLAVTLFLGFLVSFPSSRVPPILDSLCCSLWIIPLCFLSLCQFNHFSHFKMTIPQFYRSSCLSLPVSTLTATPTCPLFANVWRPTPHSNLHVIASETSGLPWPVNYCMGYVSNYLTSLIWSQSWRGSAHLSPPSPTVCTQLRAFLGGVWVLTWLCCKRSHIIKSCACLLCVHVLYLQAVSAEQDNNEGKWGEHQYGNENCTFQKACQ